MLRIHFTREDLAGTRVASGVNPMWEMLFSRLRLRERVHGPQLASWVQTVRSDPGAAKMAAGVRVLRVLAPLGPYFPDFLTPPEGTHGLGAGLDALMSTPRRRLRHEMGLLAETSPLPVWARQLAEGDAKVMSGIGSMLATYYEVAIQPHTTTIQQYVDADRAQRARGLLDGGVEGLLSGLAPMMWWHPPILHVKYDVDRDLHLQGRGLLLVPSYFCSGSPVALVDPELPPTLVYPVAHPAPEAAGDRDDALGDLIGTTRGWVLRALDHSASTSELAHRLGISLPSVSRHTTVLRRAGLVTSLRQGPSVLHTRTELGTAVLRGVRSLPL